MGRHTNDVLFSNKYVNQFIVSHSFILILVIHLIPRCADTRLRVLSSMSIRLKEIPHQHQTVLNLCVGCWLVVGVGVGGVLQVHAKKAHEGNVARPGGWSQLVGWSVWAGSRTITAVTYHHSVWLRQWHSRTPQGKNEAFIQLVSQDQAGHARNDKTICWAEKVLNTFFFFLFLF